MKEKLLKEKNLDDYIKIAKTDIYVFIIMLILISLILLFISFKVNWFYLMIFCIAFPFIVINKILTYRNLKNIKNYLIENSLLDKIGKIVFWNEKNYFLTDKYIITSEYNVTRHYKYDDILKISKRKNTVLNSKHSYFEEYLIITFKDKEQIELLICTIALVDENFKDITEFLLNKNKNITFSK